MESRDGQVVRSALAQCERACRALVDACAAAVPDAEAGDVDAERLVDAWHVAGATARLLARREAYDPTHTALQLATCREVASRTAGAIGVACAAACAHLLSLIWDRAVDPNATWSEDDDEPTCHLRPPRLRPFPIAAASSRGTHTAPREEKPRRD